MPNLAYGYVHLAAGPAATCGAGSPAAALTALASPIVPTWPQLFNAQASIGVFPPGWAAMEMAWRLTSLRLSSTPPPGAGAGAMAPSPVVTAMDGTEKGQLSYHAGTAAGLMLAQAHLAAGAGALYFPFLLTRAIMSGGAFTFANALRPDLVLYSIGPALAALNHFIVWECKGHALNMGHAPLGPALNQSYSVTNMTVLPGGAALPAPLAPAAYIASQVDTFYGDYRLQTTDPADGGGPPFPLEPEEKKFAPFLRAYYGPFHEILSKAGLRIGRRYDGRPFVTTEIIPNVRFGLDLAIYDAFDDDPTAFAARIVNAISTPYRNTDPDEVWVNATGLSVELETS